MTIKLHLIWQWTNQAESVILSGMLMPHIKLLTDPLETLLKKKFNFTDVSSFDLVLSEFFPAISYGIVLLSLSDDCVIKWNVTSKGFNVRPKLSEFGSLNSKDWNDTS